MKKIILLLSMVLFVAACGDDDPIVNPNISNRNIYGIWKLAHFGITTLSGDTIIHSDDTPNLTIRISNENCGFYQSINGSNSESDVIAIGDSLFIGNFCSTGNEIFYNENIAAKYSFTRVNLVISHVHDNLIYYCSYK